MHPRLTLDQRQTLSETLCEMDNCGRDDIEQDWLDSRPGDCLRCEDRSRWCEHGRVTEWPSHQLRDVASASDVSTSG